jgi:hypothetical protein
MPRDMLREMWLGLKRFWTLSWWWKGPSLALIALLVIGVIGAIAGGGSEDTDKSDSVAAERTSKATPKTTTQPTAEPTAAPAEPTPTRPSQPRANAGGCQILRRTQRVGQDAVGTYRSERVFLLLGAVKWFWRDF